jgi:hypothetical protein
MHKLLAKQIDGVLSTISVTSKNSEKTLNNTQDIKELAKEITSKVVKVNDALMLQIK